VLKPERTRRPTARRPREIQSAKSDLFWARGNPWCAYRDFDTRGSHEESENEDVRWSLLTANLVSSLPNSHRAVQFKDDVPRKRISPGLLCETFAGERENRKGLADWLSSCILFRHETSPSQAESWTSWALAESIAQSGPSTCAQARTRSHTTAAKAKCNNFVLPQNYCGGHVSLEIRAFGFPIPSDLFFCAAKKVALQVLRFFEVHLQLR